MMIVGVCVILTSALLYYAIDTMKRDYFDEIGKRAMNYAMIMADQIRLSDEDVLRLVAEDFPALLNREENQTFESINRRYMSESEIKYVYILHDLNASQVRYSVAEEDVDYYDAPAGTALDTIYLLDAVIDEETRQADTEGAGYTDKDRYTYLHDSIRTIYDGNEARYEYYKDEWGSYISGFAPLYSTDNTYIGMLVADVFVEKYLNLVQHRIQIMILFTGLIFLLIVLVIFGSKRMRTIEGHMEDLRSRAYLDDMTGFYNRRTLNEQSAEYNYLSVKNTDRMAAIMFDIDHFKSFNDRFGHPKGDEIIYEIAALTKPLLDDTEYAFRYGGDEFLILSADTSRDHVYGIAHKLLEAVRKIEKDNMEHGISLSMGIAFSDVGKGFDIMTLITRADAMLYQSKEKGRNRISMTDAS